MSRRAKFWIDAYAIKEARVVIRKDYRVELAAQALAPVRLRDRRASVAMEPIERYVLAENNVEPQPEAGNMDIDNEQPNSRRNALLNENYCVSPHENLAVFNAVPNAAESPEEFVSFHRKRVTRRIPQLVPIIRPIDNYFASLPRIFEALPSNGTVAPNEFSRNRESSAFHVFQRPSNESLPRAAIHSQQSAVNFVPPVADGLNPRESPSPYWGFGDQSTANFSPQAAIYSQALRSPLPALEQQSAVNSLPPAAVGLNSQELRSPLSALQLPQRSPPAAHSNSVDIDDQENSVPNLMTNVFGFIEYFKRKY